MEVLGLSSAVYLEVFQNTLANGIAQCKAKSTLCNDNEKALISDFWEYRVQTPNLFFTAFRGFLE